MKHITFYFLLFTLLLTSCAPSPTSTGPQTITIMTHDSFAISEEVIKAFEADNNAKVSFIQSGDAGSMLNQAILTKDAPIADILFGVDNTFLSRALEADIFEAYQSPELANIADEFKLDPSNRALPVDYGDVCINYDKTYFTENSLAVPQSLKISQSQNTRVCWSWKIPPRPHLVLPSCLPLVPTSVTAILITGRP